MNVYEVCYNSFNICYSGVAARKKLFKIRDVALVSKLAQTDKCDRMGAFNNNGVNFVAECSENEKNAK